MCTRVLEMCNCARMCGENVQTWAVPIVHLCEHTLMWFKCARMCVGNVQLCNCASEGTDVVNRQHAPYPSLRVTRDTTSFHQTYVVAIELESKSKCCFVEHV